MPKKNCTGCRAFEYDTSKPGLGFKCSLGYKFQPGQIFYALENCPKPRTIGDFVKYLKEKQDGLPRRTGSS